MSKNVLIISASPRKGGNSEILCDKFIEGLKESNHNIEQVFLRDKKINFCYACEVCTKNGGHCFQKDDVNEIMEKMSKSNVIVMATPVYYFTMNGQMKTLIDRSISALQNLKNKEFYFIITGSSPNKEDMKLTVDTFRGFTICLEGAVEKGIIYGTDALEKGDILNKSSMIEAYEMGKNI